MDTGYKAVSVLILARLYYEISLDYIGQIRSQFLSMTM